MTIKKTRVERQLAELHRELQLVATLLDSKLLWLSTFSNQDIEFDFRITDGLATPPTVVRHLQTNSGVLRGMRPHFENEMRRAFLNDLYLVASRHAMILDNLLRDRDEPRPEFSAERRDAALNALNRFIRKDDKAFLDLLRRLRNTVVHYEGRHNLANPLNDEILGVRLVTDATNLGESVELSLSQIYALFERLVSLLSPRSLLENQQMQRELREPSA